jgi:hypothetical protein
VNPIDLLQKLLEKEEEDPEGRFEEARQFVAELRAGLAKLAREALDAEARLRRRERLTADEREHLLKMAGALWTPEEVEELRKVLNALP